MSAADMRDITSDASFREIVGFSTEPALLRSLAVDPAAYYPNYPIPLTAMEAAELDRRLFVQEHKQALRAYLLAQKSTFAGLWTDQAHGGNLIIQFTEAPETHRAAIETLAPEGATFELRTAEHSLAELVATRDRIWAERESLTKELGIEVVALGFDLRENRVELGVANLSRQVAETLESRYGGDQIRVFPSLGGDLTVCSLRSNCPGPPFRAGISGSFGCSMAFVTARLGAYYLFTAGHCANNGSSWYHGTYLGTMSLDTFYNGSKTDSALIGPMSAGNISRWVYITNTTVNPMFSRESYSEDDPGDLVCMSARTVEAVRCGTIVDTNFTIDYGVETLYNQRRANYSYQFGDSGGAIYYANTAKGIQSGCLDVTGDGLCDPNQPIYSHIYYAQSYSGSVVNTTNCGNYC